MRLWVLRRVLRLAPLLIVNLQSIIYRDIYCTIVIQEAVRVIWKLNKPDRFSKPVRFVLDRLISNPIIIINEISSFLHLIILMMSFHKAPYSPEPAKHFLTSHLGIASFTNKYLVG